MIGIIERSRLRASLLDWIAFLILGLILVPCRGELRERWLKNYNTSAADVEQTQRIIERNASCVSPPLSSESWNNLDVENFIIDYPNSLNITPKAFFTQHGAQNFLCGIGEHCNIGPLCSPIKSVEAWLLAYSIQEWNNYMNQLYNSVGYMGSTISSISVSLTDDLMIDRGIPRLIKAVETITSLAGLFTIIAVLFGFTVLSVFIPWTGIKVAVIIALGGSLPFRVSLLKPHGEEDGFRTWSDFSYYISKGQQLVQDTISEQMKKVLNSGLRDPKLGILNAVRGGYFLDLHENQQFKMESMMTRMLKAKIISKILRINNAYIIRRGDQCIYDGPRGARSGTNVLSYCDPQGVLWDIVEAHGKHTVHKIYNGQLIANKYNFTTEEIVTTSWDCQSKYRQFEHEIFDENQLKNGTLDLTQDQDWMKNIGDCSFNLPVCDCDIREIHLARASTHKTTTQICRQVGSLPI